MTMLRGLWKLAYLETKIFIREPLGLIGAVIAPVLVFILIGQMMGDGAQASESAALFLSIQLPVLGAIMISLNAVLSLITIIAIYREGGILKRLRTTPLRPQTILVAHVLVKLFMTMATLGMMILAGGRYYPVSLDGNLAGLSAGLLLCTLSILSVGFVIASLVPTARFAQPLGSLVLYPMLGLCGLFIPIEQLPEWLQPVAHVVPLTYAVSLLRGLWIGDAWSDHLADVGALLAVFALFTALSTKVFRWE
ncbi:MAG TPA: ABC transporter permease [Vicinamibacterales bacterium]|nr:ABC transporter permease [Vicinamibacterales bacterium]